jgi:molybdopterin converting factor small subunit
MSKGPMPMNLTILFFGATADIVGERQVELEISEDTDVRKAMERLLRSHPGLRGHRLLVALNEEYASPDSPVSDGDILAVFTAVSGG